MQASTFDTVWALVDGSLVPDLTGAPAAPDGLVRVSASSPVPAGHTPAPGEPVSVTIGFDLPPPPPEPEPEPEPTP